MASELITRDWIRLLLYRVPNSLLHSTVHCLRCKCIAPRPRNVILRWTSDGYGKKALPTPSAIGSDGFNFLRNCFQWSIIGSILTRAYIWDEIRNTDLYLPRMRVLDLKYHVDTESNLCHFRLHSASLMELPPTPITPSISWLIDQMLYRTDKSFPFLHQSWSSSVAKMISSHALSSRKLH